MCWQVFSMIRAVNVWYVMSVVMPGHPVLTCKLSVADDTMVWLGALDSLDPSACNSSYRWKRRLKRLTGQSNKYISLSAFSVLFLRSGIVGQY